MLDAWEDGTFPQFMVNQMATLWNDAGVKATFKRSNEYQLNDSAGYFLDSLDRFAVDGYIPSYQDVLRTRTRTTGIVEIRFRVKVKYENTYDAGVMTKSLSISYIIIDVILLASQLLI